MLVEEHKYDERVSDMIFDFYRHVLFRKIAGYCLLQIK